MDSAELGVLQDLIKHPKPYQENLIKEAKQAKDKLTQKVKTLIQTEKTKAITAVESAVTRLKNQEEFRDLAATEQQLSLIHI